MDTQTLRVVVNPYAAVDHKGRPAAAVLVDPTTREYMDDHANKKWEQREFVGAKRTITVLQKGKTIRLKGKRGRPDIVKTYPSKTDHTWEHSKDVIQVPNTKYYQRMVQSHQLFAADKDSWIAAGGDPALYQDPALKLAHAKEGALAQLTAHVGEGHPAVDTLKAHWADKPAASAAAKPAASPAAATATTSTSKGS